MIKRPPACADCKHFSDPKCYHPDTQNFDIVLGLVPVNARSVRSGETEDRFGRVTRATEPGACGPQGILFESRSTLTFCQVLGRIWLVLMATIVIVGMWKQLK